MYLRQKLNDIMGLVGGRQGEPDADTDPFKEEKVQRAKLVAALRDSSKWPEGFVWQFLHPETCALGLLAKMRPKSGVAYMPPDETAFLMGMSIENAIGVFGRGNGPRTTPEEVADLIEATAYEKYTPFGSRWAPKH